MKAEDINIPLFEMTFERKIVEQKFRAREETINEHLVKLFAFQVAEPTRAVWKKEIRKYLIYLSHIKLKNKEPPSKRDIYKWFYSDPFVGNETSYVEGFIMMHAEDYTRNDTPSEKISATIKSFHEVVADTLSKGVPNPAIEMLASF